MAVRRLLAVSVAAAVVGAAGVAIRRRLARAPGGTAASSPGLRTELTLDQWPPVPRAAGNGSSTAVRRDRPG